jgi:2',3'-cyclic-nucleotide 2'-phosphodiesterase (5'-nucleotidase family)
MQNKLFLLSFIALLFATGCSSSKKATAYIAATPQQRLVKINANAGNDSTVVAMLKPYADQVNATMNTVVGEAEQLLEKKQPEGTLNNMVADAMLEIAAKKYNRKVDAAFVNSGGLRIANIAKGPITNGKIFELMPFDNLIVLQELKGSTFQQFLDLVAARGGWPCAGITMQIKDKKAVNVTVGGKPLDPNDSYWVANNDYVANGGDDCDMLKVLPQLNNNILCRDAIIEYIQEQTKKGKKISATIKNSVTYAQ